MYLTLSYIYIQTLRAFRLAKLGRLEAWRLGGLMYWKTGAWEAVKLFLGHPKWGSGAPKLEAERVPGGKNPGLECLGTPKLESWAVWMAVCRAQRLAGQPSWGSGRRVGRHLGASCRQLRANLGGFGSPKPIQNSVFLDLKLTCAM